MNTDAPEHSPAGEGSSSSPRRQLQIAAQDTLGLDRLRPPQEAAVLALASGRDAIVIMPTGSGKSAIYQVAGALIEGPTLVISPLISLQADQQASLEQSNAGRAVSLNSTLSEERQAEVLGQVEAGEVEFLFLAPEQLQREAVTRALQLAQPSLLVVDEAHCLVEWGHDFRPDYLALAPVIEALGRPTIVALTATASLPVRHEIAARLGMREPAVIVASLDRPNTRLEVRRFDDEAAKRQGLLDLVPGLPKPGIVYAATHRDVEEAAGWLDEAGISADAYHAGLPARQRRLVQEAFMADELDVLCATKAFGLGIDKPNIRFVVHLDAPDSLDSLYQGVGRAGRDGEPAQAVLLYNPADLGIVRFFAGGRVKQEDAEAVLNAASTRRSWTRAALAEAVGFSPRKLGRIVNQLLDSDALRADGRGRLSVNGRGGCDAVEELEEIQEQRNRYMNSRIDMLRA